MIYLHQLLIESEVSILRDVINFYHELNRSRASVLEF